MRKIATLKGLEEVKGFLLEISKAFGYNEMVMEMTEWMTPTYYSYGIDLKLTEEKNYGCVATHSLVMNTRLMDSVVCGKLHYRWITSSGHTLIIESASDYQVIYKRDWNEEICLCQPRYNVYIGEEDSQSFYPTVIETLQKFLKIIIVGNYIDEYEFAYIEGIHPDDEEKKTYTWEVSLYLAEKLIISDTKFLEKFLETKTIPKGKIKAIVDTCYGEREVVVANMFFSNDYKEHRQVIDFKVTEGQQTDNPV